MKSLFKKYLLGILLAVVSFFGMTNILSAKILTVDEVVAQFPNTEIIKLLKKLVLM